MERAETLKIPPVDRRDANNLNILIYKRTYNMLTSTTTFSRLIILFLIIAAFLTGCSFNDVVKEKSAAEIASAIKKGADVNEQSGDGETPLTSAIRFNSDPVTVAALLIDSGADVNKADGIGFYPLHYAAVHNTPSIALKLTELLLNKGASVNVTGLSGATPLFNACSSGKHIEVVKLLIDRGADVKTENVRRETPLHIAAFTNNNSDMIELLISNGADVNSGAPENTPLHRAAYSGADNNIALLIGLGAKINIRGNLSESKTPFELAVDNKQFKAARVLADNGADINSETYYYFQPFRYRNYKQSYTEKLVKMDVSQIKFEKMTPLHRTITHNDLDFVKFLVDKGAGLKTDSHFGGYPLDFSIYLGYYDISEFLVSRKAPSLFAEIYLRDAVENSDYRKAELLLRAGADVNEVHDTFRDTVLHIVALRGDAEIIKLLIKHGADRGIKNREGKTAAELTQSSEVKALLEK
jgi:ankyrin repeat protein